MDSACGARSPLPDTPYFREVVKLCCDILTWEEGRMGKSGVRHSSTCTPQGNTDIVHGNRASKKALNGWIKKKKNTQKTDLDINEAPVE